jgi:hypothetical protein
MKKFTSLSKVAFLLLFFGSIGNYSANAQARGSSALSSASRISQVAPSDPTLDAVTIAPVCIGSQANVVLSGLLPSTFGTASYKIGGGPTQTISGTSTSGGTFSFVTPVLNAMANGVVIEITSITANNLTTNFTGKTATLVVSQIPTLASVTAAPVCDGNSTTIVLSGLLPNTFGTAFYKLNNGPTQSVSGTSTAQGTFSFPTPPLSIASNGVVVTLTKIATNSGCETVLTGKTVTLMVSPKPTLSTVTAAPVCAGSSATIVLSGLLPNTTASATYKVNGGMPQIQNGTSMADGTFSFSTPVLTAASNGAVVEITKITTNNDCETTFTGKTVSLVVNSNPTLSTVSAAPVCDGNSTTIVLSGLLPNNTATATYTVNGGAPQTESGTSTADGTFSFSTQVLTSASNGAVIEITKIASNNGCETMFTGKTVSLVVNPLPNVQITGTPLVCRGDSFSLTASGGVSYAWSGSVGSNNGLSAARFTSSNASISRSINGLGQYHRIGDYTVTVTDANGCVNTGTQTVGVNPALTLNTIPVVPPVCEGSNFTINSVATITNVTKVNTFPYFAVSAGNQNDITYSWTGPNGFTSSSSNALVNNATIDNAGTYNLVITGPGGCTRTADRNVNVNPNPTITLDATAEVCTGSNITLTASSNGSIFSWFRNGSLAGLGSSLTISSADMSDAGIYTFRSRSASSLCFSEQNIELIVKPLPTLSTVTTGSVCAGNSATIVLSGLLPNTTATATYTVNGGAPQTESGTSTVDGTYSFSTPVLSAAANGSVIEVTKITTDLGCETMFTGKIVNLVVYPNPTLSTVTTTPVCSGNTATIVLSGLLPNTAAVASYKVNGGMTQTQSGTSMANGTFSFSTPVLSAGFNNVVIEITNITTDNGCSTNFTGKTVSLVVYPTPTLSTVTAAPVFEENTATILLSGLVPNTAGTATYKIGNGPELIIAGTTTNSGTFSVTTPVLGLEANGTVVTITKITSDSGCETAFTGKSVTLVVQPNTIPVRRSSDTFESENQTKAEFVVYPNPVSDILNIETSLGIQSVEFINFNGVKVLSSNQKQINVSQLPSGIYIVRIQDLADNVVMKRVVIK